MGDPTSQILSLTFWRPDLLKLIIMKKLFLSLSALVINIFPARVFAQVGVNPSQSVELPNPFGSKDLMQIINNIIDYVIYISVPILTIFVLIGGFQILTAKDSTEKVTKGRKTITYAAIGFAVIISAKGAAYLLIKILE